MRRPVWQATQLKMIAFAPPLAMVHFSSLCTPSTDQGSLPRCDISTSQFYSEITDRFSVIARDEGNQRDAAEVFTEKPD